MNILDASTANPIIDDQAAGYRRRAIRLHLAAGLLLIAVSLPTLVTTPPTLSLQYIGNSVTTVMGLLALLSFWIAYRYDATRGSILFIASILVISLGIPFYAHGLGLQAGIITAVLATGAAITTLPHALAVRASIAAFVVEAVVILLDLYLPDFGFGELQSPTVNIFMLFVVIASTVYIFRHYRTYTLRGKLVIFFILVAFIAVSVVAVGINTFIRNQLTEQVGLTTQRIADQVAQELTSSVLSEIRLLQTLSGQFEETAEESAAEYEGTDAEITEQILSLDETWKNAPADHRLIQNTLNSHTAEELHELQNISPDHVEIFLTDRFGATIAATNQTSDYYQADEEWWLAAYNAGEGAIYVGQPEFDESSKTYAVVLAVPVRREDGPVVGVLRSTLNLSVITNLLQQASFGETGKVELRLGREELLGTGALSQEEITALDALNGPFGQIPFQGRLSLVNVEPIRSTSESDQTSWISKLGWAVIVHQDLEEALQPIEDQEKTTVVISMIVLVLAALAGLFASQRIAAPIVNLTDIAGQIASGNLTTRAPIESDDEIGKLAHTFNLMTVQLGQTLSNLEQRVAERTTDLEMASLLSERRAQELQSISEISRLISVEQRLDKLLTLVTRLVSEKFDFYHTGIFLVDETRQFAVLQAANSEGGQNMLARGHRLEVGQTGLVGNVAQTGQARIALDVGTDAVYFDNPDLPTTRSEMALPLNLRNVTIGVLDVQSTKAGAFTDNDAKTLSILADQIAIAIENARLFEQNRQSLAEVESLYNRYLRQEWHKFGLRESHVGYYQSILGGRPLRRATDSDEIRLALQQGTVVVVEGKSEKSLPTIVVPVRLRGQTIGVLDIKAPTPNRRWSQDEINLAQAVSDRLALALDNARLLMESQRQTAKEQKIGEVTAKIGASINIRNVLQTAVEELGRALPGSEVVIQFQSNGKQE